MTRAVHLHRPARPDTPAAISFATDERGSITIFALVLFMLIVMLGGIAIDVMKHETIRTTLTNTLDRCALMSASLDQTLDPQAVFEDCIEKAGLSQQIENIEVVNSLNHREVTANARAETNPFFLHLIGINDFDARSRTKAEQAITNVEIALVLDISGSMSGSRITNLKSAASEFVATMLDSDPEHRISITIVPYNAQVNLGPVLRGKYNATNLHGVANVNCLELPFSVYDAPGISRTLPLPMMAYADHAYGTSMIDGYVSPTSSSALPNYASEFCRQNTYGIVRLPSQDKATLQAQINALQAGGNTSITLGMKWGMTLLDPTARPMYSELISAGQMSNTLAGRPFDYNDPDSMKVIVLMTDGEHVSHDRITDAYKTGLSPIYRSSGDGQYSVYQPSHTGTSKYFVPHLGTWQASAWTNNATPAVQQDWKNVWANLKLSYVAWQFYGRALGTTSTSRNAAYNAALNDMRATYAEVATMNAQLQTSCAQAKDRKVIVYGIAFEAPSNGQAQISACASSPSHYYNAQGMEIQSAFRSIASNLTQLKLTQ